ncbi:hypothetical protein Val02_28280 [Virgisporangium aliadipatigenens]|uniref:Uncharacterized protein n=1 Tax=Virgisporangium aliadipatigenens TaxID=741659 RepID=A0A8J4DR37_9ACTN|nr:hypothetical protein Val02_28280 [Virgisporangium aliadipatigenens]
MLEKHRYPDRPTAPANRDLLRRCERGTTAPHDLCRAVVPALCVTRAPDE